MTKLNRGRLLAIGGLAVVIGALAVSPAIGGPSLKKLVKKEVRKQVATKTGPQGAQGPQGPRGLQGVQGIPGTNGTNGATNITVRSASANRSSSNAGTLTANCIGDERAVGGGGGNFDQTTSAAITSSMLRNSFPSTSSGAVVTTGTPTSWSVNMTHGEAGNTSARVFVLCASP